MSWCIKELSLMSLNPKQQKIRKYVNLADIFQLIYDDISPSGRYIALY